jgi:hypothetical protein
MKRTTDSICSHGASTRRIVPVIAATGPGALLALMWHLVALGRCRVRGNRHRRGNGALRHRLRARSRKVASEGFTGRVTSSACGCFSRRNAALGERDFWREEGNR